GFWTYVLLFLQRWRAPFPLVLAALLAVVAHPCAFFLVARYSEALFLLGLLGFLYWAGSDRPAGRVLAAAPRVGLTATPLVGPPPGGGAAADRRAAPRPARAHRRRGRAAHPRGSHHRGPDLRDGEPGRRVVLHLLPRHLRPVGQLHAGAERGVGPPPGLPGDL